MEQTIHNGITRTVVSRTEEEETVEIDFAPGSCTAKHDHGNSHGTIEVLEGVLYEIRNGVMHIYTAGDTFTEKPTDIHIVGSKTGAKTRNVYRPPVTGTMRIYA